MQKKHKNITEWKKKGKARKQKEEHLQEKVQAKENGRKQKEFEKGEAGKRPSAEKVQEDIKLGSDVHVIFGGALKGSTSTWK